MLYAWRTVAHGGESKEAPDALYFDRRRAAPRNTPLFAQIAVGIAAIVGGAHLFVTEIELIATSAGVSPLVLALVLAPLATELPEKANSVLWSRRGQDALAIGNITGALVFQSMPTVAGLRKRPFALPAMLGWGSLYVSFVSYVSVFG